jgi:hypothetical protein
LLTGISIFEVDECESFVLLQLVIVGMVDVDDVVLREVREETLRGDVLVQIAHVQARIMLLHIFVISV